MVNDKYDSSGISVVSWPQALPVCNVFCWNSFLWIREFTRSCFLFPPPIKLYLPGLFICIRFSSLRSGIESSLDHNTLLTNTTDVPPFCPHFVCKLILEGRGERSLTLSSSSCFPHFVPTRCASFNRLSVSILAILYGRRVCLTPQMALYQFFHSFLYFLCGVWHLWWWQSATGLFYSGKQLSEMEGTQRAALQHGPRPA